MTTTQKFPSLGAVQAKLVGAPVQDEEGQADGEVGREAAAGVDRALQLGGKGY